MFQFPYMGRNITVSGEGAEDSPFVITGTGYNPALAAAIETHLVNMVFGERPWHLMSSRVQLGETGGDLAILTVRFFSDDDELLQTEIWFDVTEGLRKKHS